MTAIQFDQVSYAYPRSEVVLQEIQLSIPQGSFTVITGPEGAGKTTLCLAMAGAVPTYFGGRMAGKVVVGGVETTVLTVADLAFQVGLVLADYDSQLVAFTVLEEVAFGLENRGIAAGEIAGRISRALAMVGLAGKEQTEVASLSGGQRQRLAIASILAAEPDILVLDEATSALDPEGAAGLYGLLHELNTQYGKTVVVVEHTLQHVLPYASQLVVMDQGRVVLQGRPDNILAEMIRKNSYREAVPATYIASKAAQLPRKEVAKSA